MNFIISLKRSAQTLAVLSLLMPALARADLIPEGVLGMKLGSSRVEVITALVGAGVALDLAKTACSESVPEKNKAVANRICKLAVMPGSSYLQHPVNKVSFLLQDDVVVLIGLDVGSTEGTYNSLHTTFANRWGPALKEAEGRSAAWRDSAEGSSVGKASRFTLWADQSNALVVYAFDSVQ